MRNYWEKFAEAAASIGSALYQTLALKVAGDEAIQMLAAKARPGQPHANMLFGAVHFLLLRGDRHALRAFYPTLGGTRPANDADFYPLFQDFVALNLERVSALISTRVTNTNEVGRCSLLHAGFRALAEEVSAPVHFIELGPSAGLNLIWDRYGVRYNRDGKVVDVVSPDAALVLDCELKGEATFCPGAPPAIASRIGLELNPVDLSKSEDRDWLRALVWPDQVGRLQRLDTAIAMFLENQPTIKNGNALDLLPKVLADMPSGPVCVYHTWVTYQFSTAMKAELDAILAGAGRPIFRLGHEGEGIRDPLVLSRYEAGDRTERVLGWAHPHGSWLEWATGG